ncbi:ZZ-type zinc finger-containing 3 [Brachionus plicatilis]|uniref:ZZ-type zinc finger-containing 3 n=1 Tax=Brachionus plicatilis TaxID=10195 RepID=A0A3M7QIX7_BRAPC|nr:ZZ-type zinc finger-containing 3 [Brachionus plicatilis]
MNLDNEPFYFETDTVALRNNPDYSCLLKTLVLLEGQRVKACQDLENLLELKEQAMGDPINFVKKINELKAPCRQKVYLLPDIDWNKYYDCVDLEDLEAIKNQKINRVQSLRQSQKMIKQMEQTELTESSQDKKSPGSGKEKTKNYNKSWSVEEQRKLEELLIEFPPEDNEAARFRKIANHLGTRTPLQVQSHCQKYFIKLAKAGLPIPGRMPNMKTYVTKKGTRGRGKSSLLRGACSSGLGGGRGLGTNGLNKRIVGRGVSLNEISSMWTSFNPPITMNEENEFDDIPSQYENYDQDIESENEDEQKNKLVMNEFLIKIKSKSNELLRYSMILNSLKIILLFDLIKLN